MFYSDDPARDFNRYDAQKERWLEERPECDQCGYHIQDDSWYEINDTIICKSCMETYFKKEA